MSSVKLFGAAIAAALSIAAFSSANATVIAYGQPGFPNVTVVPNTFSQGFYSTQSNADVGNQSPTNVEQVLEGWFGLNLSFVGGGACGVSPTIQNGCTAFSGGSGNSNKGGSSNYAGRVYGVHFGNRFITFLYPTTIPNFLIKELRFGVSNIYVFDANTPEIPVPGAIWLMGSALAGLGLAGRRKKKSA
jgi:hypothetical protein